MHALPVLLKAFSEPKKAKKAMQSFKYVFINDKNKSCEVGRAKIKARAGTETKVRMKVRISPV